MSDFEKPQVWRVVANVATTRDGWSSSHQVPMFWLLSTNEKDAIARAKRMLEDLTDGIAHVTVAREIDCL